MAGNNQATPTDGHNPAALSIRNLNNLNNLKMARNNQAEPTNGPASATTTTTTQASNGSPASGMYASQAPPGFAADGSTSRTLFGGPPLPTLRRPTEARYFPADPVGPEVNNAPDPAFKEVFYSRVEPELKTWLRTEGHPAHVICFYRHGEPGFHMIHIMSLMRVTPDQGSAITALVSRLLPEPYLSKITYRFTI